MSGAVDGGLCVGALAAFLSFGGRPVFRVLPGGVRSEIFFTAVAQPDPEDLRDLFPLGIGEGVVKSQRPLSFGSASPVVVGVPVHARQPDPAARLFKESRAGKWRSVLFCGHAT